MKFSGLQGRHRPALGSSNSLLLLFSPLLSSWGHLTSYASSRLPAISALSVPYPRAASVPPAGSALSPVSAPLDLYVVQRGRGARQGVRHAAQPISLVQE